MKNPYLTIGGCVDRLYQEYKLHRKLIVACDHDNTVFDYHNEGHNYSETIEILRKCKDLGFYIVLFTGCDKKKWPELIRFWKENIGFEPDTVNKNPIKLPFGNHGKIYFNILLDDRAGLGESLEVLNKVIKKIKMKQFYNEAIKN